MSALTDLVARLPYVTRLDIAQDCGSYRWGHMPLTALQSADRMARYKCKNRARWQITLLPDPFLPGMAPDGSLTVCWPHLHAQFHRNMAEDDRYRKEMARLRVA